MIHYKGQIVRKESRELVDGLWITDMRPTTGNKIILKIL